MKRNMIYIVLFSVIFSNLLALAAIFGLGSHKVELDRPEKMSLAGQKAETNQRTT